MPGHSSRIDPVVKRIERELEEVLEALKKEPTPQNLLAMHKMYSKYGDPDFIGSLFRIFKIKEESLPNLFKGVEYEIKLDVQVSGREPPLEDFLAKLRKKWPDDSIFLPDTHNCITRYSENHFYGTESDECLVIMKPRYNLGILPCLKYKHSLEPLSAGLDNDDYVFKRGEKIKRDCSDDVIFREIETAVSAGASYKGEIARSRARTDFVSSKTGNIYTVVYDHCEVSKEGQEPFIRRQLEAEYRGYIPQLSPETERSERQIAEDLLALAEIFQKTLTGVKIGDSSRVTSLNLTKERKYDFLIR